jgi:hypothetical protein
LAGRAANFLMENCMESAFLENERLRTKLKKCQDAKEALAREGQAKDYNITQLQATVFVTKAIYFEYLILIICNYLTLINNNYLIIV